MKDIRFFEREISLIQSEELRMFAKYYFETWCPSYFWEIGASASGKFHPTFSQGEGGLVRHTKAVILFAEELLRMSSYAYMRDEFKDYVILACLFHDTCKYGANQQDATAYRDHAMNAAALVASAWQAYFGDEWVFPQYLGDAILSHMGQWSTDPEHRPFTNIDRCVHMADYMASRPFLDIPQIMTEYNAVAAADEELPF